MQPQYTPAERFWSKVLALSNGCWEWQAHKSDGYGIFDVRRKRHLAHRFAYTLLVGPIPEGLTIDHLCRNRACVNPLHLEPLTMRENILRGVGLTAQRAARTQCPRGHPYDMFNTRIRPCGRRACRACDRQRKRVTF